MNSVQARTLRKVIGRGVAMAATLASILGNSGSVHAFAVERGESLFCDPGFGIGGSNINYVHAYLDGLCLSPMISVGGWAPGPILGVESGLIGSSATAGIALVNGGDHALTFPAAAFVARGRVMYPWGILGWERTLLYGGEIGLHVFFFRATVGMFWKRGETEHRILLALDVGLL